MAKTVVGLYDDLTAAEGAVRELQNNGFSRDDISVMSRDRHTTTTTTTGTQAGEGAAAGAGTGAVLGGLGGLLVGLGALAIPGIGPILAAGPLATTLAGIGAGAAAGGIVGALVGLGIPEEQAHVYAEGVRRGGTLVMVRSSDEMADQALQIVRRFNPVDIQERGRLWGQHGWTRFDEAGEPYSDADLASERDMSLNRGTTSPAMTGDRMTGTSRQRDFAPAPRDFSAYSRDFRTNYNNQYASGGRDYTYYEPAYRYGYDLAGREQYRGRSWEEIEPQARLDWERTHPDRSWNDFRDAAYFAWQRTTGTDQGDAGYTGGSDYTSTPR